MALEFHAKFARQMAMFISHVCPQIDIYELNCGMNFDSLTLANLWQNPEISFSKSGQNSLHSKMRFEDQTWVPIIVNLEMKFESRTEPHHMICRFHFWETCHEANSNLIQYTGEWFMANAEKSSPCRPQFSTRDVMVTRLYKIKAKLTSQAPVNVWRPQHHRPWPGLNWRKWNSKGAIFKRLYFVDWYLASVDWYLAS